jgi:hypothetical protein
MTETWSKERRVFAVFPSTRGFGFAIFEGPLRPIDWGVKEVRVTKKNAMSLLKIKEFVEYYQPEVIVVEDYTGEGSRRSRRIRKLIDDVMGLALERNIPVRGYSRAVIRGVFSELGAKTKFEIAQVIADYYPQLEPRLPRFRKPWMSEDGRMSIFDAVSLALTYYRVENRGE